ncbi:hypothetical protein IVB12_28560 [Bradyrhizobium sp. 179]|uniref:hypothetical protein n=1 Tax=Bradyrhizobium sp. 179 TaxID=2782648 RepID=UPI001FF793F5|nr:hypothetical protein [Bradyrhizobium sp. 179]MCK1545785.1 hypothetical protein [Bradyrhizobium sp. 179]
MASVWLYVSVSNECVKVFASYDSAIKWLSENDPEGAAVEYPVEDEQAPSIIPKRTDVQQLVSALLQAPAVLSDYIAPGPGDPASTVDELMDVLTNDDVLGAISRIEGRQRFGLVQTEHAD